jgi:hypothetical protein
MCIALSRGARPEHLCILIPPAPEDFAIPPTVDPQIVETVTVINSPLGARITPILTDEFSSSSNPRQILRSGIQ